jgi:hypothetical protein
MNLAIFVSFPKIEIGIKKVSKFFGFFVKLCIARIFIYYIYIYLYLKLFANKHIPLKSIVPQINFETSKL